MDRTGDDRHAGGLEGSAGNAGADVRRGMGNGGQPLYLVDPVVGLLADGALGGLGQHEMGFDLLALPEDFQQPDAVDDAGRSGDADDQALLHAGFALHEAFRFFRRAVDDAGFIGCRGNG